MVHCPRGATSRTRNVSRRWRNRIEDWASGVRFAAAGACARLLPLGLAVVLTACSAEVLEPGSTEDDRPDYSGLYSFVGSLDEVTVRDDFPGATKRLPDGRSSIVGELRLRRTHGHENHRVMVGTGRLETKFCRWEGGPCETRTDSVDASYRELEIEADVASELGFRTIVYYVSLDGHVVGDTIRGAMSWAVDPGRVWGEGPFEMVRIGP